MALNQSSKLYVFILHPQPTFKVIQRQWDALLNDVHCEFPVVQLSLEQLYIMKVFADKSDQTYRNGGDYCITK